MKFNDDRYGCMAMLFTLPEYRRKGLARHCVAALCRKQLKMGLTPYLLSEDDNVASESLFRSMGFAYAGHKVQFVGYTPGQSGYEINES